METFEIGLTRAQLQLVVSALLLQEKAELTACSSWAATGATHTANLSRSRATEAGNMARWMQDRLNR